MFGMKPLEEDLTTGSAANVPPWELLHLNTAGLNLDPILAPIGLPIEEKRAALSHWPSRSTTNDTSRTEDVPRSNRIHTASTIASSSTGRNNSHDSSKKLPAPIDEKSEGSIDVPILLINDQRPPSSLANSDEPPSPLQLDHSLTPAAVPTAELDIGMAVKNRSSVTFDIAGFSKEEAATPEPTGQSLRDFFQACRATETEVMHAQHSGADIKPEESAAEYSNRQASLLMLYFPLAYIVVFSVSLVRLIHDMITSSTSSALTIMSLWFVLSAGLVDVMVYVSPCCRVDKKSLR